MSEGYIDLSPIIRAIEHVGYQVSDMHGHLSQVDAQVNIVNNKVETVDSELTELKKTFNAFIKISENRHNLTMAQSALIRIRQELEKKYGHYDTVRRTTIGILQADDLALVRQNSIQNLTEELMLTVPNYWLAPSLVALAAWISNNRELAEKALAESIKRDAEKTALLFALICNRSKRKESTFKWLTYYYSLQNPRELNNTALIILDSYTSGIFGIDANNTISQQFDIWLKDISLTKGFEQSQINQWKNVIATIYPASINCQEFKYLPKHASNWDIIKTSLLKAALHKEFYNYLKSIINMKDDNTKLKAKIDSILYYLVSQYDEEEKSLREEEALNKYIMQFEGDKDKAQQILNSNKQIFEKKKNFAELLTGALSNNGIEITPSTKKFIISISKDWLIKAYNDITATDIANIPEVTIKLDEDNYTSKDGSEEPQLLKLLNSNMDNKCERELSEHNGIYIGLGMPIFSSFLFFLCLSSTYDEAKVVFGVLGCILIIFGFITFIVSLTERSNIKKNYKGKKEMYRSILKACLAEVVFYKKELKRLHSWIDKANDFINQIKPQYFVKPSETSVRTVETHK